jgi:uncharacterized protein (DUF849 family)
MTDWPPLTVTIAPNGAYKTKQDHPKLPMTPAEIAEAAAACLDKGAAMIHLHVRDREGRHTLDAAVYRAAMDAVRKAVGNRLVIQITTEAAKTYHPPEQMAVVREIIPEAVSVATREIVPNAQLEPQAAEFFGWLVSERIMPQIILYSVEDVRRYQDLRRRGVIPDGPYFLLFVLGRYTIGQASDPTELLPFIAADDRISPWAMCAFGKKENACALATAALGGHVRVGFENNLYLSDGRLAPDNAALIEQVRAGAALLGRKLGDADSLREMFLRFE